MRELQLTIAATAETISGCLAAGPVDQAGEDILTAASPGLPAALKNLTQDSSWR